MANHDSTRAAADDAWCAGHLGVARRCYQELLARDSNDWRARAALASLDLAFGKLSVDAARALSRNDLSAPAQDHVRTLIDAAGNPQRESLDSEADWDIDALRSAGKNADDSWWLAKGRAAWEAWLFGLAAACFHEACSRSEILYDNPPRWAQGTRTQSDSFLRMLSEALPSS